MSELMLVRHCSPTLAGMKTANMFSYTYNSEEEMKDNIRMFNRIFAAKGLRVLPLRVKENRALIYVYRPALLKRDFANETACNLLRARGYSCEKPHRCILQLIDRLRDTDDFPHEIGLFLGYPPEDVNGFIEKGADSCKCSGCWKVYGDEHEAKMTFAKYKKCTKVYYRQWTEGKSIEQLTVAV